MLEPSKIEEITKGIDHHLRRLESFTDSLKEIKQSLDLMRKTQEKNIQYEFSKIQRDVLEINNNLKKYGLPSSSKYEKDIEEIKKYLANPEWPEAVESIFICDNEEKAFCRANSILDLLIGESIEGKKFLDFGCGEGHVVEAAKNRNAAFVLGCDIEEKYKFDKCNFTDNLEVIKNHAPYDIILLHDVLDHTKMFDPVQILQFIAKILSFDGRVYIRNHPWCSRHGGHLYLKKNLAFLHLVLDDIELARCEGLQIEHCLKIFKPLETYQNWINQSGLIIKNELIVKNDVERFFLDPSCINDRIKSNWPSDNNIQQYMEIDFVEYVLELPKESIGNSII